MTKCRWQKQFVNFGFALFAAGSVALAMAGCEREERVLDIKTPGADVEVDRNIDTGEVEAEVNEN